MRSNKARANLVAVSKISLPLVLLLCLLFFLLGLLVSELILQDAPAAVSHSRVLQSVEDDQTVLLSMPHGDTGESYISTIPYQVLSWRPRSLYFPNFATAEQCMSIIKMSKTKLTPSRLALRKGETVENTNGIRTSSGTFIDASEDKTGTLDIIEEKIARVTLIPRSHMEDFNILRYEIGQKYDCHYDAFNPDEYGPQKSQRIATLLLYLSDVEEGGETMFPYENGTNMDGSYDFKECIGLKVRPHRGDGILFYSLFNNGTIDLTSLHGSCPVINGEKWVATKWIRDQVQNR